MAEQNEKMKKAEHRVVQELANQAHEEPGSPQEDQAKERRAQAENEVAQEQRK
ncbi:MAG TPA: hypothetical protein VMB49_20185 [Acidobacteriaceae bacterium]|nr:hypothetical protein [Acidobacteriaceae bacterium]